MHQQMVVHVGPVTLQVTICGAGDTVLLLPASGRGVEDYADLSHRLTQAGYRVVLPQPRGIAGSTGPLEGLTLHEFGADIAAVITTVGGAPVTLVGHALGNRIARVVATDHPTLVKQIILVAAGGMVPIPAETQEAMRQAFDPQLDRTARLAALRRAYFAPGNDPTAWEQGWHLDVRRAQHAANGVTPVHDWWAAGTVPILVLQGAADMGAPPVNAQLLAQQYGERVTVVTIPQAGHAMLPEQPERIAAAILHYLGKTSTAPA